MAFTQKQLGSYVYFAITGDDFDPDFVTKRLGIQPTKACRRGENGWVKSVMKFASWEIASDSKNDVIDIGELICEVVDKLFDKIEAINELKQGFQLNSRLQVVLYVNTNEEQSTPALYFDLKTIEFLYKTGSNSDVDIYRFSD